MKKLLVGAGAAALMLASPAYAATALTSGLTSGNQAWPGALGMDFNVLSAITVTQLGAFDSGRNGFVGTVQVGIFDALGALVGSSATFSSVAAGTLIGNDRFADIADFNLGPGNYSIVAVGFGSSDPNGNNANGGPPPAIDTGGGLISFIGGSRYSNSSTFALPSIVDTGPANRYSAGTFQFVSAVPEPATYAMLLAGLAVVGAQYRRKAKKTTQTV